MGTQPSVHLIWLLYYVMISSCLSPCTSESFGFVRLKDVKLICESDLVLLTPSASKSLECARECKRRADCTAFMFTPLSGVSQSTATKGKLGMCSWCPAFSIVNVSYTAGDPQLETWRNILGYLVHPPENTDLEIPGALSVGRYLAINGRVPDPPPDRIRVTLYPNSRLHTRVPDIALRIMPRFQHRGHTNTLVVTCRIEYVFRETVFPEGVFPFSAGQNFEIAVLATPSGFSVYIEGIFMTAVNDSAFMVGDVRFINVEKAEFSMISF
ncbi:hypothetical protein PoB_006595300 [Plakobranchus ocellatus]|uniref:Galectin n=1 Tax=Plakobranchus ocellatus TaxID=259542 RepID=A0AAV4D5J1_9GAST|nr:hypothetical protein PoB_006595300 [Plakobranchus ocellatus]